MQQVYSVVFSTSVEGSDFLLLYLYVLLIFSFRFPFPSLKTAAYFIIFRSWDVKLFLCHCFLLWIIFVSFLFNKDLV